MSLCRQTPWDVKLLSNITRTIMSLQNGVMVGVMGRREYFLYNFYSDYFDPHSNLYLGNI